MKKISGNYLSWNWTNRRNSSWGWRHFLWFCWNRPRIFAEDIYEKHVLEAKRDKANAEYNYIMKECELLTKIQFLEMELNELKKREN